MYEIATEIAAKPWPAAITERFDSDPHPIILIFDRDWKTFDPREHGYAMIWVAELRPEEVPPLLEELARRTRRGDDVIAYLRDVAERQQRAELRDKAARDLSMAARIASYVKLKPSVFGVSIDLKAICVTSPNVGVTREPSPVRRPSALAYCSMIKKPA